MELKAEVSRASLKGGLKTVGKSSHMAAVRSLGILHELQEYVSSLQQTAAEQDEELRKLKDEKEELKRGLRVPEKQSAGSAAATLVQHFQASELADLPPRLRALFEDNKVLKEQVRRYRHRAQDAERSLEKQEQKVLALTEQVKQLKGQLADAAASPEAQAAQQLLTQQVEAASRALEKLQDAHEVLQLKLNTDAKVHRQALAAATKERHQLEQQVEELKQQLEHKSREARAHAITAKQAQRKLEEVKAAAAKAVATVDAKVADAVAAQAAKHKALEDARVHLMLCFIRDDAGGSRCGRQQQTIHQQIHSSLGCSHNSTAPGWPDHDSSSSSATHGEGGCRPGGRLTRDEAAARIQAAARGFLARRKVKRRRAKEETAAVLIQAGARGMHDRKRVRAMLSAQRQLLGLPALPEPSSSNGSSCNRCSRESTAAGSGAAAAITSRSSSVSSHLPMELPALPVALDEGSKPLRSSFAGGGSGNSNITAESLQSVGGGGSGAAPAPGTLKARRTESLLAATATTGKKGPGASTSPPKSAQCQPKTATSITPHRPSGSASFGASPRFDSRGNVLSNKLNRPGSNEAKGLQQQQQQHTKRRQSMPPTMPSTGKS